VTALDTPIHDTLAAGDPSQGRDPYLSNQAAPTRLFGRDRRRVAD